MVGVLLAVGLIIMIVVFATGGHDRTSSQGPAPTVDQERCVGLKDPLPPGAPKIDIPAGPAPTALERKDLVVGTEIGRAHV